MKKRVLAIVLAVLLLGAAGCQTAAPESTSTTEPMNNGEEPVMEAKLAKAKDLVNPWKDEANNTSAQAVAQGANDFAFRFSAQMLKTAGTENFVCSPYSAWMPLAALLNATNDAEKDALLQALGTAGIGEEDVNNAVSRMLYSLNKAANAEFYEGEQHTPLSVVNAVFVGQNQQLNNEFAQIFLDYFRGEMMQVDFGAPSAVQAVNDWASEKTNGLITDVVTEFDPATVAALANAIYFSDRWDREFDPEQTREDVFYAPGGETQASYMQREGYSLTYYEDDKVQMMPLTFKTGGTMYIILPKDKDANGLLSTLDTAYFNTMREDSVMATGKLLLPRFTIENSVMDIRAALMDMGVPLFDEDKAPLTGGLVQGEEKVWLSDAVQKAMIRVDEKGTTAAAVTVMAAETTAIPEPTEPFEMNCNTPFVFVLCDSTYDGGDQVLFTGVVNRPAE